LSSLGSIVLLRPVIAADSVAILFSPARDYGDSTLNRPLSLTSYFVVHTQLPVRRCITTGDEKSLLNNLIKNATPVKQPETVSLPFL
jgi:hypothetical protein